MPKPRIKDTDIQALIGWILRLGVLVSMIIALIGGIIYIARHGHEHISYVQFKGVPEFVHSPSGVWQGILALRGRAIIQLGIMLLVFTPVLRIMVSGIGFLLEKDYLYVGITLLVLLIIVLSALTGHGG